MGIPDRSLIDLIERVWSWIYWGASDLSSLSEKLHMDDNICKACCECEMNFTVTCLRYYCQSCGRMLCRNCARGYGSSVIDASGDMGSMTEIGIRIKSCRFCSLGKKYSDKIYPSESPRQSPEPPSSSFSGERFDSYSPHATRSGITSFAVHPSPVSSIHCSFNRSDEEDGEDSMKHFFSPSSEYCHDTSDIDSSSVSARHEFYSFKSVGSSPSDSPSRIHITSNRVGHSVQKEQGGRPISPNDGPFDQEAMAVFRRPEIGTEDPDTTDDCADDLSIFRDHCDKLQKPLDFENNGLIWFPPPPGDEDDEIESNFFASDDEDDDIGESCSMFSSSISLPSIFPAKEKQSEGHKEPLRAVVQGHFRALVSQLLQGEGIKVGKENSVEEWLDIITTIAWQAANFVKPDTSRGGSMDPGDYVKIKCIASGNPSESTLIKGVVCTKNIKHKRMTSQYKNPRLLLLGGALEYQRVPNQLSSFDTLLQQEIDHLKMIVSKIETHHTNVLLVEKSVSSYAQEYLLAKEISLVLNVKRPLLERIARCTGALITPSIDHISTTRLGHCELFRLERMTEDLETQCKKKPSKTLMFFEGCPRRLGCTVLLKGSCREELKKVKHVVQYAVFAAHHLSLETSFLADEGASLPKMKVKPSIAIPERTAGCDAISVILGSVSPNNYQAAGYMSDINEGPAVFNLKLGEQESLCDYQNPGHCSSHDSMKYRGENVLSDASYNDHLVANLALEDLSVSTVLHSEISNESQHEVRETLGQEERLPGESYTKIKPERIDEMEASSEYYSATDSHQSILVSFSSRCVLNGSVCERSRLLRIKFYGSFDKPLGRYLRDDLFDETSSCRSCKEPAEAHVLCYTHQQGNLTINVRRIPSVKLPGERDGKIWMWHRCLRCAHIDGVPPATRRVVMSDAAWGLSFGKFLELSFSNHATANRVASCGHSLQRDCLRYYGFGSMVAFFRYSPIEILSVHLPPSVLEFNGHLQQKWIRKEASELLTKTEALYAEISDVLDGIEQKCTSFGHEPSDTSELHSHIVELKDLLVKERNDYNDLLQPGREERPQLGQTAVDILELNRLRHSLLIGSHVWDRRIYSLDSLLKTSCSNSKFTPVALSDAELKEWKSDPLLKDGSFDFSHEFPRNDMQLEQKENPNLSPSESVVPEDSMLTLSHRSREEELYSDGDITVNKTSLERIPSAASNLSDKIDSAWTGTNQPSLKAQFLRKLQLDGPEAGSGREMNQNDSPPFKRLLSPTRVYSFDSAVRLQERIKKGLPPSSLHLSTLRSFHASGDYRSMVRDPVQRSYSQMSTCEAQKLNFSLNSPSFISSASLVPEGARLLLPQAGQNSLVIAVYDSEPTSIISYALSCKEYEEYVTGKLSRHGGWNAGANKGSSVASSFSSCQSFGSMDLDYVHYRSYGYEDASSTTGTVFADPKNSPHPRITFEDDSSTAGSKVKLSVTCYFAKHFDALRKKCCPSKVDFVCSLSRCRRWSAQGGKSNVYFAKSLDERFIIKQVTKTELESFEEFAPEYFKYLTDSLGSGSPTCLAKILGIYQVTVKHLKGGKETKMDLMIMENLFFKRNISRVYDLKGSSRSRYNSDTTGANKVLLDMNLLEALRTDPIFLGSKAKRSLERAVWNDTSFLASVDVMDYSLLVGVDEERKELVLGIIDFMRQYTWDKHLETWVKASGILGGRKNAPPTIISPKQYKRRFRKAMTTYFLTVPDQWTF
ncbi:putative 1-phosphatidylinositol-3-phosphate 5-kinase FAB1C [Cornus florida]|uniref:putative 1-phosphatidylinositol-3-phosphate 5-kinase FAB1C n=1 Tax=Cornus florida TaxID=4283 RepID=UPI0028989235|nr:putative 1-phosphatidylinositol-3-phosphate 5-kinase FAB1C [Cornus florida]XP_059649579.1 putative 1-phosphatidylinositol-3-phosphate 5-kinase FAB1C [Cornus florida]